MRHRLKVLCINFLVNFKQVKNLNNHVYDSKLSYICLQNDIADKKYETAFE